eukprot:6160833-Prymnesium_polylepis.1
MVFDRVHLANQRTLKYHVVGCVLECRREQRRHRGVPKGQKPQIGEMERRGNGVEPQGHGAQTSVSAGAQPPAVDWNGWRVLVARGCCSLEGGRLSQS